MHPHFKAHRQRPVGRAERARQQSQWRRQSERSDRDGSVHSTPVSPPNPSSGVASPRSGWALAALNTPAQIRLSALARFGSSVKKSLYPRKGKKFHCLSRRWNFRLERVNLNFHRNLSGFQYEPSSTCPAAASGRPRPCRALSRHAVATDRAALPTFTDLLGIRGRSH